MSAKDAFNEEVISESGVSRVFVAILIAGVVAFVVLGADSRKSSKVREIAEEAALAGAAEGAHYLSQAEVLSEEGLIATVNGTVETLGIPDTDGKTANEVNKNVTAFYVDENGAYLQGCTLVGSCGSVPDQTYGVKVKVYNSFDPIVAKVMGIDTMAIKAESTATLADA